MFFSFLFVFEIIFGGLGFVCVEQAVVTVNGGGEGEAQEKKRWERKKIYHLTITSGSQGVGLDKGLQCTGQWA